MATGMKYKPRPVATYGVRRRIVTLDAARSALRHPGQAKREPGPQKGRRFNLLRSRIRLRLSGMTDVAICWRPMLDP